MSKYGHDIPSDHKSLVLIEEDLVIEDKLSFPINLSLSVGTPGRALDRRNELSSGTKRVRSLLALTERWGLNYRRLIVSGGATSTIMAAR